MLMYRRTLPLDYSLCCDTVTVYHRQGGRRVLENAHLEDTAGLAVETAREAPQGGFLLIIPGGYPVFPGDKVLPGVGPEAVAFAQLNAGDFPGLGVIARVCHRRFRGAVCHTEARGN